MFSKTASIIVRHMTGKITNNLHNNLQVIGDARPYAERRLDAKLCDQDVAQGFKDRRLRLKDDSRPYAERRLDAKLCDQDVAQGFKDRRLREVVIDMSVPVHLIAPALGQIARYKLNDEEKEEARRLLLKKEMAEVEMQRKTEMAKKMKQFEEEQQEQKQRQDEKKRLPVVKNPEMVLKMAHWFRGEVITDEFYREHLQFMRDQIGFARDLQVDDAKTSDCRIQYNTEQSQQPQQPRRRQRIVVV
jgi:hypothetical protein